MVVYANIITTDHTIMYVPRVKLNPNTFVCYVIITQLLLSFQLYRNYVIARQKGMHGQAAITSVLSCQHDCLTSVFHVLVLL